MTPFLLYMARASLYLALFYAFYLLVMRRTSLFRFNRAALLLGTVLFPWLTVLYFAGLAAVLLLCLLSILRTLRPALVQPAGVDRPGGAAAPARIRGR